MSILKKNALAAAVLTGLFLASSASAFDASYNALTSATGNSNASADQPSDLAVQLAQPFVLPQPVQITAQVGDNFIGRTTGFQVRVTLPPGYEWETSVPTPTFTPGESIGGGGGPAEWVDTLSPASDGSRFLVYSVQVNTASVATVAGRIADIGNLAFRKTSGLPADGEVIALTVELVDSNASTVINSQIVTVATFTDGLAVVCTPTSEAAAEYAKIDVKADGSVGDAAKTDFVLGSPWTIGTGTDTTANLGAIRFDASAGVTFNDTTAFGVNVTPGDLDGIVSFGVSNTANCAAQFGVDATASTTGVYNIAFTGLQAGTAGGTTVSETVFLCVNVDGTTTLAAQDFTVSTLINTVAQPEACPVAPLEYNGSVVKVFTWNPASNTRQESLVRIINDGSVDGDVSIIGIEDDGTTVGPVSFSLAQDEAVWLSASALETGTDDRGVVTLTGSLGAATGKRRLEITGEFDRMIVSDYKRNGTTNTLANSSDADTYEEQKADNKQ